MASLDIYENILGQKFAKHLIRRSCFHYNKSFIDKVSNLTPDQALDLLFQDLPLTEKLPYDPLPSDTPDGFWTESTINPSSFNSQIRKRSIVSGWWWYNAINSPTIKFKLSHFLSTRFTIQKSVSAGTSTDFYDHVRLLLYFAYGNYKTLAKKMTLDNSMLDYLDNTLNGKNSPNENYAREFFELFTIGKGPQIAPGNYTNYTEEDIVQAAKVLTGFKKKSDRTVIDSQTGLPKGYNVFTQHSTITKVFSSAFGNHSINSATSDLTMDVELDDFVEMVFNQNETAKHICRKLYIYFVKGKITDEIEQDIIEPLSKMLKDNDYELQPIVRKLLTSKHFFDLDDTNSDDETIGAIVKSPIQLLSEICTYFSVTIPNPASDRLNFYSIFWHNFVHETFLKGSNMVLFDPENVAGHPAYYQEPIFDKSWISSSTLIARYKLIESIFEGRNKIRPNALIAAKLDISKVLKEKSLVSNPSDPYKLTEELCNDLFAQTPDSNRINYFTDTFLLEGMESYNWTNSWDAYAISGDNSVVEPRLKSLIIKLINSPESQIF